MPLAILLAIVDFLPAWDDLSEGWQRLRSGSDRCLFAGTCTSVRIRRSELIRQNRFRARRLKRPDWMGAAWFWTLAIEGNAMRKVDASIILGPLPSWKRPIALELLNALADRRADVSIRVVVEEGGTRKTTLVADPTGQAPGELFLVDGRLQTRNPTDSTLCWMLSIAEDLGGRVIDNTLSTYRSPTERYLHPDDVGERRRLDEAIREAGKISRAFAKRGACG